MPRNRPTATEAIRVYAVAGFGDSMSQLRELVLEAGALLGIGIEVTTPDRLPVGRIAAAIQQAIARSDVVVADVSGESPNVLFELGIAQTAAIPMLLIARDPGVIPFDLASRYNILIAGPGTSRANVTSRLAEGLLQVLREKKGEGSETARTEKPRRTVFISYSHVDAEFVQRILIHLRPLERAGLIDAWSDTRLRAGDRWREEVQRALDAARIAVLVMSADFLASDFIESDELPPLLTAAEKNGTVVIPIIAKPSRFVRDHRLSGFQAINDPERPLIAMDESDREAIYAQLAERIEAEIGPLSLP